MLTNPFINIIFISCTLMIMTGCQLEQTVTPADISQNNITGKLCDQSGAPVKNATVYLVEEEYSTLSDNSYTIDSTISDGSGLFGFQVTSNGKYNLLAKSNDRYAFWQSITISTTSRMELPAEKMFVGGSVEGTVQLQSLNNHSSAIILFPGTNIYAAPLDSTGKFQVQKLAQGSYKVRLLSMVGGFEVKDTTVTVVSGTTTIIPTVLVPQKKTPKIDNFNVAYDPLMMEATLSWTCNDTGMVDSFKIYCNRHKNILPVKTVNNNCFSVTFDLLSESPDSFTYQISALRKDGWEETAVIADPIINKSSLSSRKITLSDDKVKSLHRESQSCLINKYGFYILFYDDFSDTNFYIMKLDSNFNYQQLISLHGQYTFYCHSLCFDNDGNIFVFSRKPSGNYHHILKLDRDLNIIDSLPIAKNEDMPFYSMAVASNGNLLLYNTGIAPFFENFQTGNFSKTTEERIYDRDFELISERVHNDIRTIMDSKWNGDFTTAIIQLNSRSSNILTFDQSFNCIRTDSSLEAGEYEELYRAGIYSDNIFYGDVGSYPLNTECILYFFNSNNEIVARHKHHYNKFMPLYDGKGPFSSYNGKLYSFIDKNTLVELSLTPVAIN